MLPRGDVITYMLRLLCRRTRHRDIGALRAFNLTLRFA